MKKFNLFKIITGVLLALAIVSCNKEDGGDAIQEAQGVSFDISNFIPDEGAKASNKSIFVSSKDESGDATLPECSDAEPSYVIITIDGVDTTLELVTLNDKTETEVVKLSEGMHTVSSFIVYAADDTAIWASPMEGSYYDLLWGLKGVDFDFEVEGFTKQKIEIDVLCYEPFNYENFGFAWFAYSKTEIHTICFFGDICTKFYEDFHAEGSPYFGQDYDGYDFPAIFEVVVKDASGNVVNDPIKGTNAEWFGAGSPLCIEYPDAVGVDESFTFEIWLAMPAGDYKLVHTGTFDDTALSTSGDANGFGGTDGIFDFVVGNCSYDGNDGNLELPAYVPTPESGKFTLTGPLYNGINYVKITFSDIIGGHPDTIDNGMILDAFCADIDNGILLDVTYDALFYSSLAVSSLPTEYQGLEWGSLNWIMNNLQDKTGQDIQAAIWHITNNEASTPYATEALTHTDFVPTVGDYAIVLCDPIEGEGENKLQLMIVRVDP